MGVLPQGCNPRRAEEEEEAKRDEIRNDRRREIERDLRMNRMGTEQRSKLQKRCVGSWGTH